MKVGIIGATGKAGSRITSEAMHRGMEVIPLVRNAKRLPDGDFTYVEKDLFDLTEEDIANLDVIVDAFNAPAGKEELHQKSLHHLITLLRGRGKPRLIVVGGAGSLYVDKAHQTRLQDTPDFPESFKPTAENMAKAFEELKKHSDFVWTYISPSAMFFPEGERTEEYQIGKDELLTNSEGNSEISYADYALALVDEIERAKYLNQRITVCSK
ncbi:NAD(P)-dependent oxidoreductase [Pisciglobus halotolerans]|uniref:NAD(P)-binding domain-containing protein n=1 Tax=Pisciglobus halotolerans TaxID=745365 RepID=A0A1I3B1S5_9LACT|nr:NAD(P)-dependent oxidoreductase [Pisciglobus halotolerans]SFH56056.1 hypothetical protein SAMN04489868_10319 [Pisciglobus halotolerans]